MDDGIPRNSASARDGFDFLEGRGPGGPAESNVIRLPIEPPRHIATAQIIRADAGIPPGNVTEPVSPERAGHLFLRAARSALSKFLAGEYIGPEEAHYLEALDEMRRQGPKP